MSYLRLFAHVALLAFAISSCKTPQSTASKPTPLPTFSGQVSILLDTSAVLSQSFTGFMLYDLNKKQTLFERNANRYFTPASNTKLYTFYACLKTLGDSIPALRYVTHGDSLIFWGTGDPTFLHPDFKNTRVLDFFAAQKGKNLFFSTGNFTNESNGSGWAWDDYNDNYQPELTPLPMYGNILRATVLERKLSLNPPFFKDSLNISIAFDNSSFIQRNVYNNDFQIPPAVLERSNFEQDIPLKTSALLTQQLLIDTLKRSVGLLKTAIPKDAKTLYSMPVEPVYRKMMQESDNMLAEHLLFLCGSTVKDTINSLQSIDYIKTKYLTDLPDAPKWVDGSGLSRYNLFTPRTTVKLLEKIYANLPQDKLFSLLPTGGIGTLGGLYTTDKPFLFAKSGSLSGVYNLSGYLMTKQGKFMLFSFMNNNFNKSTTSVRKEVERILTWVHLNN